MNYVQYNVLVQYHFTGLYNLYRYSTYRCIYLIYIHIIETQLSITLKNL